MSDDAKTPPETLGRAPDATPSPRRILAFYGVLTSSLAVMGVVAWLGTGHAYVPLTTPAPGPPQPNVRSASQQARGQLATENRRLRSRLARLTPRGLYIVIDQAQNRLYLKEGERVLLAATCSSGSGMVLLEEGSNRRWVFDTPRGRFQVTLKLKNPVWRKPDWAFVEEGLPVPKDPAERLEYGSLGEYALYLADGYMIHGTLYERLLGRSVTHGCVRLGRDDLRTLYKLAPIGTPVFIY